MSGTPDPMTLQPARTPAAEAKAAGGLEAWQWSLLVGLAACAIALGFAPRLIRDGDTHLHIAAGRWMIQHWRAPSADPFSYSFSGKPWVPHEWLSEIVLAVAYAALGWGGVLATTALAIFAIFVIFTRALSRWLAPALPALAATIALILYEPHLLARPHIMAAPFMMLFMSRLILARDEGRGPPWTALPVLTLWANLHGSFLVGIAFSGMLGLEAVWEALPARRVAVARDWGIFVLLTVLFALISPNGVEGFLLPYKLLTMKFAMTWLTEWRSTDFGSFQPLEVWIALALLGGTTLGLRLPLSRVAMIVVLLHMALSHERNTELLGLLSPILIAKALGAQLHAQSARWPAMDGRLAPMPRRALVVTAVAILVAYLGAAATFDVAGFRPSARIAPEAALAAARRAGLTGHVLNSEILGGFLIFSGVSPFIDGRADMYGDDFLRRFQVARDRSPDVLAQLLKEYDVQWTFFPPDNPAVGFIDHMPGWSRVYADPYAVVQRRD